MNTLFDATVTQPVTPAQALVWLGTVDPDHYRPVSPAKVALFRSIIEQGRWEDSFDPIVFDTLGRLRGGRMRLLAIAQAGIPVTMRVLVPPSPQPHETIPGVYQRQLDDTVTEAVRWTGDNFDDVRDWIERDIRDVVSIEQDRTHRLTVYLSTENRIDVWACPGDWLVRTADSYSQHDHAQFANEYAYRRPA